MSFSSFSRMFPRMALPTSTTPTVPQWEDYKPPERTYESWTGSQMADWYAQQGGTGNWWDAYQDVLNPEGRTDFDYNIYANAPIAQMYQEDGGDWQLEKMYPEAYNLYKLRTETPEDWWQQQGYDYQDLGQSDPYQNLTSLLGQWSSQADLDQQTGFAGDYAAKSLGFGGAGDYQQAMSDLTGRLNQIDFSGQLTQDQQQALSNDIRVVREESMKMMEAMQAEGRHAAAFYKADEISSQIGDMYVQGKLKYMEHNMLRSQVEYQAMLGRYEQLAGAGMQYAEQYFDQLVNQRMTTLQGYATQMSALAQQNSQYIDLYKGHVEQMYQSIMADIGYDQHQMQMNQEAWEQYCAPALQQFEMDLQSYSAWLAQQQVAAANKSSKRGLLGSILGAIGTVLGAIIGGPVGAVAGGAIGGSLSAFTQ